MSNVLKSSPHLVDYLECAVLLLPSSISDHFDSNSALDSMYPRGAIPLVLSILKSLTTRSRPQKSLLIRPLKPCHKIDWRSDHDVPVEVKDALRNFLRGSTLKSVKVNALENFDFGVFRVAKCVQRLYMFGLGFSTAHSDTSDSTIGMATVDGDQEIHRFKLNEMIYHIGGSDDLEPFVQHLESPNCAIDFASLSSLKIRDREDLQGAKGLSRIFKLCRSLRFLVIAISYTVAAEGGNALDLSPLSALSTFTFIILNYFPAPQLNRAIHHLRSLPQGNKLTKVSVIVYLDGDPVTSIEDDEVLGKQERELVAFDREIAALKQTRLRSLQALTIQYLIFASWRSQPLRPPKDFHFPLFKETSAVHVSVSHTVRRY
ncbi:hypothetical protein NLJ89_g6820 [Agrocybe chaxingu]|uniref:Uncharacterized protein n=1 Tax=Agrocybe chaxingu TaxID=84603 RepID=A0A9W8K4T1_9AGAR|nr:hypothetical protein NLJ89_g6820 [Agrocybe chaxingu]